MKRLFVLRHAKSSWKDETLPDHERPLNKRGKRTAPLMGRLMREKDLLPQLILSSTALRCRQTVEAVIEESGFDGPIRWLDEFYMAGPEAYLDALAGLEEEISEVMVVGHNPGLEELIEDLTGQYEALPTGSLALLELAVKHWSDLKEDVHARLVNVWRPKEISR